MFCTELCTAPAVKPCSHNHVHMGDDGLKVFFPRTRGKKTCSISQKPNSRNVSGRSTSSDTPTCRASKVFQQRSQTAVELLLVELSDDSNLQAGESESVFQKCFSKLTISCAQQSGIGILIVEIEVGISSAEVKLLSFVTPAIIQGVFDFKNLSSPRPRRKVTGFLTDYDVNHTET